MDNEQSTDWNAHFVWNMRDWFLWADVTFVSEGISISAGAECNNCLVRLRPPLS